MFYYSIVALLIIPLLFSRGISAVLIGLFMLQCAINGLFDFTNEYFAYVIMISNNTLLAYFIWRRQRNEHWRNLAIITYTGTQLHMLSLFLCVSMDYGLLPPHLFLYIDLYVLVFTYGITLVQMHLIVKGTNGPKGSYERIFDAVRSRTHKLRSVRRNREALCQHTPPT